MNSTKPKLVYKIRKKGTETFSNGSTSPRFTSVGRIFSNFSGLVTHVLHFRRGPAYQTDDGEVIYESRNAPDLSEYEAIEYELVEQRVIPLDKITEARYE